MIRLKAVVRALKLLPSFSKIIYHLPEPDSVFLHDFQELSHESVIREDFILNLATGRRVLHFGFLDAPFTTQQILEKTLLHQQIQQVAEYLYGVDIDEQHLNTYRNLTGDLNNGILNIQDTDQSFDHLAQNYNIILFPEVLEHLLYPSQALENLRKICILNKGSKLCITVPNALSSLSFFIGSCGNESVHPDHYFYFSPYTIKKLLVDCGFSNINLCLYSRYDLRHSPGLTRDGITVLCDVCSG